jgi:hypothetical protein
VSGRVADGEIIAISKELRESLRPATEECLKQVVYKNNPYATQISFHTKRGLECLQYIGYEIIKEV